MPASTVFMQSIVNEDGGNNAGPGQANYWDLSTDFSLNDGSHDQFDGALMLSVAVGGTSNTFPSDQTYAELTALGPDMGVADGLKLVSFSTDPAFVVSGTTTAYLHAVPNARLQQTLNLGGAVGALTLSWSGNPGSTSDNFGDEPGFVQVVLRDTGGNLLTTLYRQDRSGIAGTWGNASLTAYAGQTVVLSFEQYCVSWGTSIDDVSVTDTAATPVQFVVNGNFEAGSTGWTVPAAKSAQNIRSGSRTLMGLVVQRTFYSQPNLLWGRWTDTFTNPTAAAINAVASYDNNLGSDTAGIIYPTPGATQKSLTNWDGSGSDRDYGMIFGAADVVTYRSASALNTYDGSETPQFQFNISVPPGATVTLMNFIVMTGTSTWMGAVDITAKATEVDTQAADIANNFRTNLVYQRGLTQQQLDTLKNF
ncbi:hypothetical protein [Variovorax sp. HW608]|uniref:hypothetical protein n=1 Tax=Variovorax sp. HW608 TaxID=1034889 RepID=UPI0012FE3DF8|nr:hypothetical protein [Variovorax sp. HW608]